jgi:hypothetical protein
MERMRKIKEREMERMRKIKERERERKRKRARERMAKHGKLEIKNLSKFEL